METNHGYIGYLVAVNPTFWRSLPDDIRSGVQEAVAEATAWGNAQAEAINQQARGYVEESGRSEIVELTDDELTSWQTAMAPVWEQFEVNIGAERIEAASSL
jgi:C4-dicarboxylate-binding protein DctP